MLSFSFSSLLSFNSPSTMLKNVPRAPTVSMDGSMEYKFVYESAASRAEPMGYGKSDSTVDLYFARRRAYMSRFSKFVYESAAANAEPLGDGKGLTLASMPAAEALLEAEAEALQAALETEAEAALEAEAEPAPEPLPASISGDSPITGLTGKVVPTGYRNGISLEQSFVYESAGARAAPLGDGKGN
mmetsp:Transcript_41353/g.68795  ORF Transcript_41353/g.68795 Transcript_41353/m.68795 type:complete len:187 (-) Transcript_41353:470-1030(-)